MMQKKVLFNHANATYHTSMKAMANLHVLNYKFLLQFSYSIPLATIYTYFTSRVSYRWRVLHQMIMSHVKLIYILKPFRNRTWNISKIESSFLINAICVIYMWKQNFNEIYGTKYFQEIFFWILTYEMEDVVLSFWEHTHTNSYYFLSHVQQNAWLTWFDVHYLKKFPSLIFLLIFTRSPFRY